MNKDSSFKVGDKVRTKSLRYPNVYVIKEKIGNKYYLNDSSNGYWLSSHLIPFIKDDTITRLDNLINKLKQI